MDCIVEVIELKQAALEQVGEGDEFEEEEAEKLVFINQMYYNLALCCCLTQVPLLLSRITPMQNDTSVNAQSLQNFTIMISMWNCWTKSQEDRQLKRM